MTRITLQGIGAFGGFGTGVAALERALEQGPVAPSSLTIPTGRGPVELPAFRADLAPLEALVPARTLRRMDNFSKMALLGAHLALADAGLEPTGQAGLGIIIASGYGATTTTTHALLDSMSEGDVCTSPIHFANSMHNTCAANISLLMGATGPNLTVSQFHLSVPAALLAARQWLLDGRAERVLFGAVEELSDLIGYLWLRQRGEGGRGPMRPLATRAESALPGEGAAFFLLSCRDEARPGYATLEEVATGRGPLESTAPVRVLGADGRRELGDAYAALGRHGRLACFTPHYGSHPATPAFDLAAAALMLRRGTAFSTPAAAALDFEASVLEAGEPLGGDRIACLTLADRQGYGAMELGRL